MPRVKLCGLIEPVCGTGETGHPPVGLERLQRFYWLPQWLNLSDAALAASMFDTIAKRSFVGVDPDRKPAPDDTTIQRLRRRLEKHGLGKRLFEAVGRHLQAPCLKVSTGTIVDATIISAPSWSRNHSGARDPEMHQARKGKTWHFGVNAHIGAGSRSKMIHALVDTAAKAQDRHALPGLLHGAGNASMAKFSTRARAS